ncbi:MAG: cadmium resistance transporter [Dolichospermum sp. WA123]|nr:cadmium resistance transporter [Dolichospermum sp. WA123]
MSIVTAISTGAMAFSDTNIDDLVILTLFFSQVDAKFRRWHIIIGQYLGFTALILTSLPGFFGGLILPRPWIGLFGLVPIIIGIKSLMNRETDELEDVETETKVSQESLLAKFFNLQTYSVAAVTFANGTDNISIYVPIFASSNWQSLLVILAEVLNVKILRIVSKLCIGIGDTKFDQLMTLFSIDNGFYLGKTQRL